MPSGQVVGGVEVIVRLPLLLNMGRRDELIAFTRYCAIRISNAMPGIDDWEVSLARTGALASASVRARRHASVHEATAMAPDLAGALWNAMCRIEERLSETTWAPVTAAS